jgi:polyisoprenoid-binding protein YceI
LQAAPLDAGKSQINFTMKQLNVPVTGSFKKFSGNVVLDLKKPEAGKADISIDTASISLPTAEAVGEAKGRLVQCGQIPDCALSAAVSRIWVAASCRWLAS